MIPSPFIFPRFIPKVYVPSPLLITTEEFLPAFCNALRISSLLEFAGISITLLSGSESIVIDVGVSLLTRYFPSSLIARVDVYLLLSGLIPIIEEPAAGLT